MNRVNTFRDGFNSAFATMPGNTLSIEGVPHSAAGEDPLHVHA